MVVRKVVQIGRDIVSPDLIKSNIRETWRDAVELSIFPDAVLGAMSRGGIHLRTRIKRVKSDIFGRS